ncbi:MAG: efflux RND transporter periplasmic adaptor subunit [Chloroflexota bacterium]
MRAGLLLAVLYTPSCTRDAKGASASGASPGTRAPVTVTLTAGDVAEVQRQTIEEGTPITGDLRPIESAVVRAGIEGDIEKVFVREGQAVTQGQVLARFAGSIEQANGASTEAERVAAVSDLDNARWNLDQTAQLYKIGAIAERDFKIAGQAVATSQARLAAAESRVRATAIASRDIRVVAPTSGVVDKRLVEAGEHIARGASLFTVIRSDVLELQAAVSARRASAVRIGQQVRFTADGRSFAGQVARVSPTIDPATRSVTVYIEVPNGDGRLKGGTFATGRIIGRTIADAVVVPTPAVRQAQGDLARSFVYRIERGSVEAAPVSPGLTDDERGVTELLSGVSVGDRVVVGNVGTLGRGMQVQVIGAGDRPPQANRGSRAPR